MRTPELYKDHRVPLKDCEVAGEPTLAIFFVDQLAY